MMPRWQRAYVLATCAVIGGAFAYAAADWGQWPRLTYMPLRGELAMKVAPGTIGMTYFGQLAWGAGGAAVGAIVGAVLCRVWSNAWPARRLHLFGAWAITAVVLAGCYFWWTLWPW